MGGGLQAALLALEVWGSYLFLCTALPLPTSVYSYSWLRAPHLGAVRSLSWRQGLMGVPLGLGAAWLYLWQLWQLGANGCGGRAPGCPGASLNSGCALCCVCCPRPSGPYGAGGYLGLFALYPKTNKDGWLLQPSACPWAPAG